MKYEIQQEIAAKEKDDVSIGIAIVLLGTSQMVQIFPAQKEWCGADGRGPYRLSNPEAVVQRSMAAELINYAMIDRDHARQLAPVGTSVKAAGWFKRYEAREDGSIWGEPDWTPKGREELDSKEYRYFSATFMRNKTSGEILAITGGTITNDPNFRPMQALASKEKSNQTQTQSEEKSMKPELIALAKSLGLDPEKTSEKEILAAAQKNHETAQKTTEDVATLKKALGLDEDADTATVVETASKRINETAKARKPDPEAYVPKTMYDELATRMDKLEKGTTEKAAQDAVIAAMKAGKVSPGMKEWAIDLATKDMTAFEQFVEKAPAIVSGDETAAAKKHADENGGLTQEDVEVAKQLGVDLEDLKKKDKSKDAA